MALISQGQRHALIEDLAKRARQDVTQEISILRGASMINNMITVRKHAAEG